MQPLSLQHRGLVVFLHKLNHVMKDTEISYMSRRAQVLLGGVVLVCANSSGLRNSLP
jgi:hypothetical protein